MKVRGKSAVGTVCRKRKAQVASVEHAANLGSYIAGGKASVRGLVQGDFDGIPQRLYFALTKSASLQKVLQQATLEVVQVYDAIFFLWYSSRSAGCLRHQRSLQIMG